MEGNDFTPPRTLPSGPPVGPADLDRFALDHLHALVWLTDERGAVLDTNRTALDALRVERAALLGVPLVDAGCWASDRGGRERLRAALDLASMGEPVHIEMPMEAADGERTLDLWIRPVERDGRRHLLFEGRDVTVRRSEDRVLEESERRYRTLVESLEEGIVLQDESMRVLAINGSAERILGLHKPSVEPPLPSAAAGPGWQALGEDGLPLAPGDHPTLRALRSAKPQPPRVLGVRNRDGTIAWIRVNARPLVRRNENRPYAVLTSFTDTTETRAQEQRLQFQARHDNLTGLPNRQSFFEALARATARTTAVAVMYLDLDGFKDVNDQHGHAAGDRLLADFAARLERSVRPGDLAARLAGDEFAVLLADVREEEHAVMVAERILDEMRRPFTLLGRTLDVSTSIGIALGDPGGDQEDVVLSADFALRHAKQTGKGRYALYDQALSADREARAQIEADLRRAVGEDQLEVYYQPIVDAKDQELVGVEALMRWRHPERGMVGPAEFIPVAESTGIIVELEAWLMSRALSQLRRWNERHPTLRLSMNLSVRQLETPDFAATLQELLLVSGVDPANVVLEITETYAMQHTNENLRRLHALAELGVSLAIDDFGTGYSNLGYLQYTPFRIVKIDRSFLHNVPDHRLNTALVRTIIAMAQALDLQVVAEGVETSTQASFLYWEGADYLQGYQISRPVPAGAIESGFLEPVDRGGGT